MTSPAIGFIHFLTCCNFCFENAAHNRVIGKGWNHHVSSHLTVEVPWPCPPPAHLRPQGIPVASEHPGPCITASSSGGHPRGPSHGQSKQVGREKRAGRGAHELSQKIQSRPGALGKLLTVFGSHCPSSRCARSSHERAWKRRSHRSMCVNLKN